MAYDIKTIEPTFVLIQYDLPEDSNNRNKILSMLRRAGFVRQTFSVYYGHFSLQAVKIADEVGKETGAKCIITTPTFPDEQIKLLADQYENRFIEQFAEANDVLQKIEKAFTGEVLMKDKDTGEEKPCTAKRIMGMINHVKYLINDLHYAISSRKDRGEKADYESLESRLRQIDSYLDKLDGKAKEKLKKEEASLGAKPVKEQGKGVEMRGGKRKK